LFPATSNHICDDSIIDIMHRTHWHLELVSTVSVIPCRCVASSWKRRWYQKTWQF